MKTNIQKISGIILAVVVVVTAGGYSKAHAAETGCLGSYNRIIGEELQAMSFHEKVGEYAYIERNPLYDVKSKLYFNDGKGRKILGAVILSTGRVVVSTAVGAALGFAAPYVASGAMVAGATGLTAVICGVTTPLIAGIFCWISPTLVTKVAIATASVVPAVVSIAPFTAAAGAGILAGRSIALSTKDSIHSVRIGHLSLSRELVIAANSDNEMKFLELYKKFPRSVKNKRSVQDVMAVIKTSNANGALCINKDEPMTFKDIGKALKYGILK